MGLLHGEELTKVVELFVNRGVFFYHACQLKDFKSYVRLGGIPSRDLMDRSSVGFTAFESDNEDRANGVWSKVFGNLSDFGLAFAQSKWIKGPIPNPYGPILLLARPSILLHASDVAICLRSAGVRGFNREEESLSMADEVDRLFTHAVPAAPYKDAMAYVKFSDDLRREFGEQLGPRSGTRTLNPEISCTVEGEVLPLQAIHRIEVDQYHVDGRKLVDVVASNAKASGVTVSIVPRSYKVGRPDILSDLAREIDHGTTDLRVLTLREGLLDSTRDWARLVLANNLAWQFSRFATYLRDGTLAELRVDTT